MEDYLEEMKKALATNTLPISEKEQATTTMCPICLNRGWVLWEGEDGNTYAKECDCGLKENERQENKLKFANVPETYKETRLKDIKVSMYSSNQNKDTIRAIMQSIKYYLEHLDAMVERGQGLYFWSSAKGSGKTMTATALANELVNEYKKNVKFATSMQIINAIKSSWNTEDGITESKLLKDLCDVEFLVIDDFGTEKVKDWISEKFYHIINTRYIDKKVTIFTSNCVITELDYDERITNRIAERTFKLHFPEESVRTYIAKLNENDFVNTIRGKMNEV